MSTITVTNIKKTGETASRSATGVAAAWIYFNGSGTVEIQDSSGVSSLTDNSTGNYNVNLSNNMASTSYCWSAANNMYHQATSTVRTVSSFNLQSYNSSHSVIDADVFNSQVNGDLA